MSRFAVLNAGGGSRTGLAVAVLATVGAGLYAAPASAQVPFRAMAPRDGATVRETVKIMYPRTALGKNVKYFTIQLDNKFRTAVDVPTVPVVDTATGKEKNLVKTDYVVADPRVVTILWDTKGLRNKQATEAAITQEDKDRIATLSTAVDDGTHVMNIIGYDAGGKKSGSRH